jgi:quinol monooxygenase YgiN
MSSNNISLQITVHISPENVVPFFEAFRPAYEKVIQEPECTFFELYQDPASPGQISWVENW